MQPENTYTCSDQRKYSRDDLLVRLAAGKGVPIRSLQPGARFRCSGMPEVTGAVVSHGLMGTRVRYGSGVKVTTVVNKEGETVAEFSKATPPDIISSETAVDPEDGETFNSI